MKMSAKITEVELNRLCALLQGQKEERRQALEEIYGISQEQKRPNLDHACEIFDILNRPLGRCLTDRSEVCRDLTIEIYRSFLKILKPEEKHVSYLISILSQRLGTQEYMETSEDVRLKSISLLSWILPMYEEYLVVYAKDLTLILTRSVVDQYPNVRKESCNCISQFAKTLPKSFHGHSESLVKPLLTNFGHRLFKVRLAAVRTVEDLILFGDSKLLEEVATPLGERLFDQSAVIRAAVTEVAGKWLMKLRDRYAWWHKIIPLLITGLHDEIEEIRLQTNQMWEAVGQLYMKENQSDERFKDKLDYLIDKPEHYPPNVFRPNLGCRTIAQQSFGKLIPGIAKDLGDWIADIRMRSVQLLCVFIVNLEQEVVQYVEKLLSALYRACNDEDERVVKNACIAAEYLGYFVQPEHFCRLILPTLEESPTTGHLRVFSSILRGSPRKALHPLLQKIGHFLQKEHICRNKKVKYQKEILFCCRSLLLVAQEDCAIISQDLFTVIFTVWSMVSGTPIAEEAQTLLCILAEATAVEGMEALYDKHITPLILSIAKKCESWSVHCPEALIFHSFVHHAPSSVPNNYKALLRIVQCTMVDDTDPELRARHFILLSEYLSLNGVSQQELPYEFLYQFLETCVIPGLVWSAGRAAQACRTAVVYCLCALLEHNNWMSAVEEEITSGSPTCKEYFLISFKKLEPILMSLVEDNSKGTRIYSLKAILLIVRIARWFCCITKEHVYRIYPAILNKLDDGCDDVRIAAIDALIEIWAVVYEDYNVFSDRTHIVTLYTIAIVHLDDPEPTFQIKMSGLLKKLAKIHPDLLYEKLQNCRSNFRNQAGIDSVLDTCRNLLQRK